MTLVSYDARMGRQSRRSSLAASLLQTALLQAVFGLAERLLAWRQQRLEARALDAMPAELRKDLGWPGADRLTQRKL